MPATALALRRDKMKKENKNSLLLKPSQNYICYLLIVEYTVETGLGSSSTIFFWLYVFPTKNSKQLSVLGQARMCCCSLKALQIVVLIMSFPIIIEAV
jgi:hypothetical protein